MLTPLTPQSPATGSPAAVAPVDLTPRAVYRSWIGYDPRNLAPADHAGAQARAEVLRAALDQHGSRLTPRERKRLRRHWGRWMRRAQGQDPRFEVVGTRPGRLSTAETAQVALVAARTAITQLCTGRGRAR